MGEAGERIAALHNMSVGVVRGPRLHYPPEALEHPAPDAADGDIKAEAARAAGKLDYSMVPPVAEAMLARAMEDGAKYGRFDWRDGEVSARARYAALRRHLADWISGCDADPDSGVHPLALVMGGCAILLDAQVHDRLKDDRLTVDARP